MTISSNASFDVINTATVSVSTSDIVQPAVSFGAGGQGQMTHPTYGLYQYTNTPTSLEGINAAGPMYAPLWSHEMTLGGGANTVWARDIEDSNPREIWSMSEVGCLMTQLNNFVLWRDNPPDHEAGSYITWYPDYASNAGFNVIIRSVKAGGAEVALDTRLESLGYAPLPVIVEYVVFSAI